MSEGQANAIMERAEQQLATMGAQSSWLNRVLEDVQVDPALELRRKLERSCRPVLLTAIVGGRR